jgi:hypothetical protein
MCHVLAYPDVQVGGAAVGQAVKTCSENTAFDAVLELNW